MNRNNKGLTTSVRLGSLSCSWKKNMPKKVTQAKCISTIIDYLISLDYYSAQVNLLYVMLVFKNIQIC